jgi:transposase-like protein
MVAAMETTNPTPPGGAKRRRLTENERGEHLIAWKRSGRSARDYAAEHGLRAANLYAWSKKKRAGRPERESGSSFVPVRIALGGVSGTEPRVTLKTGGLECVIEGADAPEAFAALAGALKREVFDV